MKREQGYDIIMIMLTEMMMIMMMTVYSLVRYRLRLWLWLTLWLRLQQLVFVLLVEESGDTLPALHTCSLHLIKAPNMSLIFCLNNICAMPSLVSIRCNCAML